MHELPLVMFTVLTQAGAGAFVILYLGHKLFHLNDRQLGIGLFCAMVLFGLGVVLGSFHLGKPLHAMNVFNGLGRSPMSNEILVSVLFGIAGGIAALGMLLKKESHFLFNALAAIASLLAIIFIVLVPLVYQIDTVGTWKSGYTMLFMILTAFICGGTVAAALGAVRLGSLFAFLGAAVSLAFRFSYVNTLSVANAELTEAQYGWFITQAILLAVVVMLSLAAMTGRLNNRAVLVLAVVAAIAAELLGRIAFYNLWFIPISM